MYISIMFIYVRTCDFNVYNLALIVLLQNLKKGREEWREGGRKLGRRKRIWQGVFISSNFRNSKFSG